LNRINKDCGVQISIDKTIPSAEIRGDDKGIAQAEQMILEVLQREGTAEAADKAAAPAAEKAATPAVEAAPKPKAKAKAKEFKGDMTQDFPTLGGEAKKAQPAGKAWGKKAQAEDKGPTDEAAEYPDLGGDDA